MADLKPVDYDPFAGVKVTPVEGDPFAQSGIKVTPVDEDPFDGKEPIDDSWLEVGRKVAASALPIFQQSAAGMAQTFAEQPISTAVPVMPGTPQAAALALADAYANKASAWLREKMGMEPDRSVEVAKQLYADATADLQENAPNADPESLKSYAYDAATSLIQMLPAVAATIATKKPAVGAGIMGAQVAGTEYGESRAQGRTPEQARGDAVFSAAAEAIPEMFPLGVLMKPGGKFFGRVFKTAGAEWLQEMFTQTLQTGYDAGILDEDMTFGEAMAEIKRAGIIGAITGGTMGAAAHPFVRDRGAENTPTNVAAETPTSAASDTPPSSAPPAPDSAAATTPQRLGPWSPPPMVKGATVGLKNKKGPPTRAEIEAIQDGYVFWRDQEGNQHANIEEEFRRDLTAPPPPRRGAEGVAAPPGDDISPPVPTSGDINDFDPYAIDESKPQKTREQNAGSLSLPQTDDIRKLRDAANAHLMMAAEAQRILDSGSPGARTPQDIAAMRVEAARLMDQAADLERKLTPRRESVDPTAATPEQMAARRLGPLGTAPPAASEATTGPQEFEVKTPAQAGTLPAQATLAPVERSEAEFPQEPQVRPKAPEIPWQDRLRQRIAARSARVNDPELLAKQLGTTPEEVSRELSRIAGSGPKAPIQIVRGSITVNKKTGEVKRSKHAGRFRYTPRPTGNAVEDLLDFVLSKGGIRPDKSFAGELQARDLHRISKPFKGKLVNPNAKWNLEDIANLAMQEGFLVPTESGGHYYGSGHTGVGSTSANVDAFFDMLDQNAHGTRRHFRLGEEPLQDEERPATARGRKAAAIARLQELGFEPKGTTPEELEAQLDEYENAIGDLPPVDSLDLHRAMEQENVDRLDDDAKAALQREVPNDYPHEYDDEWFRQEAGGTAPAAFDSADERNAARAGQAGTVTDREGAAAEGAEGADAAARDTIETTRQDEETDLQRIKREASEIADEIAARKKRAMIYDADEKERIARLNGLPPDAYYDLPFEEWQEIYRKANGERGWLTASDEGPQSSVIIDRTSDAADHIANGGTPSGWVLQEGRRTGHEYLVIMHGGQALGATTSDSPSEVAYVAETPMFDPTESVSLYHNHPIAAALSTHDIRSLGFPGTAFMVAVDHEGNVSAAALSPDVHRYIAAQRPENATNFMYEVYRNLYEGFEQTEPDGIKRQELTLRALAAGGVIEYHTTHIIPADQLIAVRAAADIVRGAFTDAGIQTSRAPHRSTFYQRPAEALAAVSRRHDEIRAERQADPALRDLGRPGDRGEEGGQGTARATARNAADRRAGDGQGTTRAGTAEDASYVATTEKTDQGDQYVLPGAERSDRQALDARASQERIKPKKPQKAPGGLFDQPTDVIAKLFADESGTLTLPQWNAIKRFFSRDRQQAPTPQQAARDGLKIAARVGQQDTLQSLSLVGRWFRSAVSLAAVDRPSSVYWNALLRRDHVKKQLEREAIEQVQPYLGLPRKERDLVNKVLEHDRLYGVDRQDTGRTVVVRIPDRKPPFGEGRPELSKPGEIVALSKEGAEALFRLREFFDRRLLQLGEAAARERGYDGEFTEEAIQEAIDAAGSPRERKPAQAALEILQQTTEMRRTGYVPFQRYGDTFILIKPKAPDTGISDTETAWFELVDTKSVFDKVYSRPGGQPRKPLQERITDLEKRFPRDKFDWRIEQATPKAVAELNIPAMERAFATLNLKADKNTAALVDSLMHQIFERRKAGLRKQSQNVPGYSTDFERSVADYVRQTSAIIARMSTRKEVDSAFDAVMAHPTKEVRDYWETHQHHMEKEGGDFAGLRKFGFFMFLWGSPASAAVNLTQTPLVTQMQLSTWAGLRAPGLAHSAMLEGLGAIRVGKTGLEIDFSAVGKTDAEKAMIRQLKAEGRLDPVITEEFRGFDKGRAAVRPHMKALGRVYEIGASGFNVTESANRIAAALAYFRAAQNQQLREKMAKVYANDQNFKEMVGTRFPDPVDIARFGVDETQFIGGKLNRMPAMRGVGALVFQFKTYIANYLRLLHKNFTRMGPAGKMAGALQLMALLMISGLAGAPFGDDILGAINGIMKVATGIDHNLEYQFRNWIADSGFGEYAAEVLTRGFGRDVWNVDIGGRLGMGNIFPDNSYTSLAPILTGTIAAINDAYERWHTDQPAGAAATISNMFVGKGAADLVKGLVQYPSEGISTKRGNWLVMPDEVTTADMTIRALGLQPTKASRAGEKLFHQNRIMNATREKRSAQLKGLARNIVLMQQATAKGDRDKAARFQQRIDDMLADNVAQLLDPSIPDWQKVKPATRTAIRRAVQNLLQPEIAALKRAGKLSREELLDMPFVEEE